jgi:ethanolamine ammonia-lyase small subunit
VSTDPIPAAAAGASDAAVESLAARVRVATPARIFTGRAGTSYRTGAALLLRADHAAAQDAVHEELNAGDEALRALGGALPVTPIATLAGSKAEYLRRPDLGRQLSHPARAQLAQLPKGADLQLVLGDGLSVRALREQAPALVSLLTAGAAARGWSVGGLPLVRYCRVGILNDIGVALSPVVVVLLIGERPGLATASSLSAYLAFKPRPGHNDGDRNLVANIHPRGLQPAAAAERILALAAAMRAAQAGGVAIKEPDLAALPSGPIPPAAISPAATSPATTSPATTEQIDG